MSAALLLGSAAVPAGASAAGLSAAVPFSTGLFGAGGSFSLGTALGTIGTGLFAVGSLSKGFGEANIAEANAKLARQQAEFDASRKRRDATPHC